MCIWVRFTTTGEEPDNPIMEQPETTADTYAIRAKLTLKRVIMQRGLPPMATEIAGNTWIGHDFVKTRLHLSRSRQCGGKRFHIQRGITESKRIEHPLTVFLVVDH